MAKARLYVMMGLVVVVLSVGVGVGLWIYWKAQSWSGPGTTPYFLEELEKRCFSYTRDISPVDCTKIVEAFENAFIFKDPCKITEEDYEPLLKLTKQSIPCGKVLLWSKTKAMAHRFTQQRQDLFTLEDALLGYLADGLSWCGFPDSNAMNYQSCPTRGDCKENPVSVFWDVASKTFAQGACGVVNVLLNGTRSNAFDENSTFGRVELHTLKASALHVWLLHDQEGEPSDTCSGSSIAHLESIASGKSMTFNCQDIKSLDEMRV
ncbi:ADP-ribosyl cyclase/cyclic ADP-ribose hydrolase 1 isoform X2 [Erinaceus europaeus]|uniref:ADP-ribosyl cyclase/cyclic ADP-ribose hydrolase 1 n=1 Tax=Erinaceus europaeus TaxID=9365 RepID=A0ABM3X639_ERIEU|nr:ADP-ribosyl cyclase/cyclic ADP-ribose hydrolase 1 isoform X2 [Erinaceus europaeus]